LADGRKTSRASISGHAATTFSTVGINEAVIRRYIDQQEAEDRRLDQSRLFD
jgi:hypothetical protein